MNSYLALLEMCKDWIEEQEVLAIQVKDSTYYDAKSVTATYIMIRAPGISDSLSAFDGPM